MKSGSRFTEKMSISCGLIEFIQLLPQRLLLRGIRRSRQKCFPLSTESRRNSKRARPATAGVSHLCAPGRPRTLSGPTTDWFPLIKTIAETYPDCALTLSAGERSRESYQRLFDAGADRYLLRHETATESHYAKLHPVDLSFANRMECLQNLKDILGIRPAAALWWVLPGQTIAHILP